MFQSSQAQGRPWTVARVPGPRAPSLPPLACQCDGQAKLTRRCTQHSTCDRQKRAVACAFLCCAYGWHVQRGVRVAVAKPMVGHGASECYATRSARTFPRHDLFLRPFGPPCRVVSCDECDAGVNVGASIIYSLLPHHHRLRSSVTTAARFVIWMECKVFSEQTSYW